MKPTIAFPMNDPAGLLFPHLWTITADLKDLFASAHISVPLATREALPGAMAWLHTEPFYRAIYYIDDPIVGDDFLTLYETAARRSDPAQIMHICYIDRVAYALQSEHRLPFIAAIKALELEQTPIIFERSLAAWQTHPRNYFEIENMVSTAAKWRFGRALDLCWCHIALPAGLVLEILPTIKRRDMAHVAEYILPIKDAVQTRSVDWLAWEDPFILHRDPADLKTEREQCPAETYKRLSYAVPMLNMILDSPESKVSGP